MENLPTILAISFAITTVMFLFTTMREVNKNTQLYTKYLDLESRHSRLMRRLMDCNVGDATMVSQTNYVNIGDSEKDGSWILSKAFKCVGSKGERMDENDS